MEKENLIKESKLRTNNITSNSPVKSDIKNENINKKEDKAMDVLDKIREEERAKLEELKEREQEKTRLAIEQERARLEAELAREIRDLESQLSRAKNASINVKARTPISTGVVEIPIAEDEVEEVIEEVKKPAKAPAKTVAARKTTIKKTTARKATSTAAERKAKEAAEKKRLVEEAKAKEAAEKKRLEEEAKAKEAAEKKRLEEEAKAKEAAEKKRLEEEAKAKEAAEKKRLEEEKKAKEAAEKKRLEEEKKAKEAAEKKRLEEEKKAKEAAEKKRLEEEAKAKEAAEKKRLEEEKKAKEAAEKKRLEEEKKAKEAAEKKRLEEEKKAKEAAEKKRLEEEAKAKEAAEKKRLEEIKAKELAEKKAKEVEVQAEKSAEQKPTNIKKSTDSILSSRLSIRDAKVVDGMLVAKAKEDKQQSNTAITSLQKLREKIAAQKRLERELMESEALRVQEKEKTLQEKFLSLQKIIDEEENFVTQEELEQERIVVDKLRQEKDELEQHIDKLQGILDNLVGLSIDGVKVIDNKSWELTEEFLNLKIDADALNETVIEIEEELDALTISHEEYINKLIKAEENYKTLEELYQQQEKLIGDLNKQVANLREQVAKEKVLNRQHVSKIEKLQNDRIRLERSYKYIRPFDKLVDYSDDNVHGVLSDLERLNEEVRKLISSDESKRLKDELLQKDIEIENLKEELELLKVSRSKEEATKQNQFYANGANMFIPRGYAYPPFVPQDNNLELYLKEVSKLREEIESLKTTRMSEPVAKPETFTEEITEVEANPDLIEEEIVEELYDEEDYDEQLLFEDLDDEEIEEEEFVEDPNLEKIRLLEEQIREKDNYISQIKQEMTKYTEDDIFDPNFKRKIRVIRDKKSELVERSNSEKELFQENTKELNEQISLTQMSIDSVKDKIFKLDLNYRQNRDFSSSTKDQYEKAKSKALVELQLKEEKLNNFRDDLVRAQEKYENFIAYKEDELKNLDEEEVSTIEYYLNKMIKDKVGTQLKNTEYEKQNLVNELDQLKFEEEDEEEDVITEIDAYTEDELKDNLLEQIELLENELNDDNEKLNLYKQKISELKEELNKRVELESSLKQNDEDIYNYTAAVHSYEDYYEDFTERNERISMLQLEIDSDTSLDKEMLLRKKAELSDLVVHREDLRAKIDYFKLKLNEFEANNNVSLFKKLSNQIVQINKITKDHEDAAENLRLEMQEKETQLELLRSELKML